MITLNKASRILLNLQTFFSILLPETHPCIQVASPVPGRDFAHFAADRVRHSFARHPCIARLQHSMFMDWCSRTQPHVYITSLLSPHVAL